MCSNQDRKSTSSLHQYDPYQMQQSLKRKIREKEQQLKISHRDNKGKENGAWTSCSLRYPVADSKRYPDSLDSHKHSVQVQHIKQQNIVVLDQQHVSVWTARESSDTYVQTTPSRTPTKHESLVEQSAEEQHFYCERSIQRHDPYLLQSDPETTFHPSQQRQSLSHATRHASHHTRDYDEPATSHQRHNNTKQSKQQYEEQRTTPTVCAYQDPGIHLSKPNSVSQFTREAPMFSHHYHYDKENNCSSQSEKMLSISSVQQTHQLNRTDSLQSKFRQLQLIQ